MPTESVPEATKELKAAVKQAAFATTTATAEGAEAVAAATVETVKTDPVTTNALNQEPWYQSGVGVFGIGGLLWSVGYLLTETGAHGLNMGNYDIEKMIGALGQIGFAGMVLYRRFMPGLKPLFWRWGK